MSLINRTANFLKGQVVSFNHFSHTIWSLWESFAGILVVILALFNFGMGVRSATMISLVAIGLLTYARFLRRQLGDLDKSKLVPFTFSFRLTVALILTGLSALLWIHVIGHYLGFGG